MLMMIDDDDDDGEGDDGLMMKTMMTMTLAMITKIGSVLSSSFALAKAKAASINWMQLLTDLQASLQICS